MAIIMMIMVMSITGCSKKNSGLGGLAIPKLNKVDEDDYQY